MAEDGAFKEMQASISSALVNTTRISGQIAGQDLPFHRSLNPSVGPLLDRQASRLLSLAQNLIRVSALGTEVTVPRLEDEDSVDDNWRGIVDVIDNLLEKADATLDEYTGLIKKLGPSQTYQDHETASLAKLQPLAKSYRTQEMEKPQLLFDNVPTNDETSPFKPMLRSKPHAIVSLEESLVLDKKKDGSSQYENILSDGDLGIPRRLLILIVDTKILTKQKSLTQRTPIRFIKNPSPYHFSHWNLPKPL